MARYGICNSNEHYLSSWGHLTDCFLFVCLFLSVLSDIMPFQWLIATELLLLSLSSVFAKSSYQDMIHNSLYKNCLFLKKQSGVLYPKFITICLYLCYSLNIDSTAKAHILVSFLMLDCQPWGRCGVWLSDSLH